MAQLKGIPEKTKSTALSTISAMAKKLLPRSVSHQGVEYPYLVLSRMAHTDQGTTGNLMGPDFNLAIIEPPWRDNKSNISCIPAGRYLCVPYTSSKFGRVWLLMNTKNRTYILIHSGNFAGDKEKGFLTHSQGCLIIGKLHGQLHGQAAVLSSRPALNFLRERLGWVRFVLDIEDAPGYNTAALGV